MIFSVVLEINMKGHPNGWPLLLNWFDNNDTVSYGCVRVALEPQP